MTRLVEAMGGLVTYIEHNAGAITDYAARWEHGEIISAAFAESTFVEAAFIELPDDCLNLAELPAAIRARLASMRDLPAEEREQLLGALLKTDWNVSQAAAELQLSRMTLYRKMANVRNLDEVEGLQADISRPGFVGWLDSVNS